MKDIETIRTKAKERYNAFHRILFFSELTKNHETSTDCCPDMQATAIEKKRVAKEMAVAAIGQEIAVITKSKLRSLIYNVRIKELQQMQIVIRQL